MAIWVIVIIAVAVWSSKKATQAKEVHRQQMERHKAQFEERVSATFSRFKKKNEPEGGDKQ